MYRKQTLLDLRERGGDLIFELLQG